MAIHHTTYSVEGAGPFPVDMLRYDASYPSGQGDVGRITAGDLETTETREVELVHVGDNKRWLLTEARWRSFGWRVTKLNGYGVVGPLMSAVR